MPLLETITEVVNKINKFHINDPAIYEYWRLLTEYLCADEEESIKLLDSIDSVELIANISSVYDDVSNNLQSIKFIACIERCMDKFPEANTEYMVQAAKDCILD